MKEMFRRFARLASVRLGSTWAFLLAICSILVWLGCGRYFHFSDTWQLVANTATSIVTFLMVFLIQNTQNRDTMALHLKLDELIRSTKKARNSMIDLERLSDDELAALHEHYLRLCTPQTHGDATSGHAASGDAASRSAAPGNATPDAPDAVLDQTDAPG
jgi:low affinity Fe/Cu permease